MYADTYRVKLTDIFEGPMDLLVHLIKRNEVSIYDIPIARLTDQYLEYIEWMKAMSVDVAGNFILMAATLLHIKSKMLLPVHDGDEDDEDPRMEIVRPLTEYLKIKDVAEQLAGRDLLGVDTFIRGLPPNALPDPPQPELIPVGLVELLDAFRKILDNVAAEQRVELTADRTSIQDRIGQIADILEERGDVSFESLFEAPVSKSDLIVTFLALLEMVRLELVRVVQNSQTGVIRLFYQ
jgi:segregation and condensation protein A